MSSGNSLTVTLYTVKKASSAETTISPLISGNCVYPDVSRAKRIIDYAVKTNGIKPAKARRGLGWRDKPIDLVDLERDDHIQITEIYESLIQLCAFLVFIGVALEMLEIYLEHNKRPTKTLGYKLIPPALIAGGVFGELLFGIWIYREQQSIRVLDDKMVASAKDRAIAAEMNVAEVKIALAKEERQTAEAKERLAYVIKKQNPRFVTKDFRDAILKSGIKGSAHIVFLPDDGEAYSFAQQIWMVLLEAGWQIPQPQSIPRDAVAKQYRDSDAFTQNQPSLIRIGGQLGGVSLVTNGHSGPWDSSYELLSYQILKLTGRGYAFGRDEGLPDGYVRIIVGPKD